ncbi:NUDIX hydrolase [Symbiobacterium thermophilum]|uniref:ADP-ribose pyrophosphatase n=1 Tax=Symbiobacterium thermophilum TaxID=2734 RepID=A0A953IBW4_SYMTR|nr:NUDIX hydrolase [Symbiobacterium thermophilum]MBY6277406.1 ADP-ribose pyrophosphatase [Symbiobacterium thermophilum]
MRVIRQEEIYRGRVIAVRRDRIDLDGKERTWDVVAHPGAVVVLPVDGDDLLMVRQYRYAAGETLLELVAGGLEPGEDPAEAAQRELQEEAGFRAGRLIRLAEFYSAPGFCTEKLHLFAAEELTPSRLPMDEDEQIELVRLSLDEALRMALAGELRDAKTLAGVLLYARLRGR